MTIPRENELAFFPPSRRAGNVTLGPLTPAKAVRIAALGVDLGAAIPKEKLFEVAYVLAGASGHAGRVTVPASVGASVPLARRVPSCGASVPSCGASVPLARWLKNVRVGLNELCNAVETVLNDAFATYVKPASGGTRSVASANPSGLGWPLEYAEFLCAEYGWDFETAIHTPVATVYALYAAYRKRNGGKSGMDYLERAYAKTLAKSTH